MLGLARFSRQAILLLALACVCARADIIHLKNGKTLHGEVVKETPEYVVVRVPGGEVKLRMADVEVIERQSAAEYRLDLGRQYLQQRDLRRAVQVLEEAQKDSPENAGVRRMLAGAYDLQAQHCRDNHRFGEARGILEKLLKLDPGAQLTGHQAREDLRQLQAQEDTAGAMTAQARRLAAAEEWPAAIAAYEAVINFTPDARAAAAPALAQCYIHRALEYSRGNRLLNAAADLESALRLDPAQADSVEKFYIACALPVILANLDQGDIPAAQADLKRVLSFAPTNKNVLYVAGRLEESLKKLPAAADYYARALNRRAGNATPEFTASLRSALEAELGIKNNRWKIDTELAFASQFKDSTKGPAEKLETGNFTVFHNNSALASQVAEAAEYHRTRIMGELGLSGAWNGRAKIYLHRTQAEYTAQTGQPEWTGGFSCFGQQGSRLSDPQIHSWQTSPRLLKSVLPHEITHLLIAASLGGFNTLPKCLHEGYAVLMEPQFKHGYFMNFLRIRIKSQDFIPLSGLLEAKDYPQDPEFFYAEGYALLEYLSQTKGLSAVTALLKDAKSTPQTQAELLRAFGSRSLEELESGWKRWILSADRQK